MGVHLRGLHAHVAHGVQDRLDVDACSEQLGGIVVALEEQQLHVAIEDRLLLLAERINGMVAHRSRISIFNWQQ
jgi:hypothetical protein